MILLPNELISLMHPPPPRVPGLQGSSIQKTGLGICLVVQWLRIAMQSRGPWFNPWSGN